MVVIVEDAITMLDSLGEAYRHGRHPDSKSGRTAAQLLRRLAGELDA
jgi:CspA family cold shock protein